MDGCDDDPDRALGATGRELWLVHSLPVMEYDHWARMYESRRAREAGEAAGRYFKDEAT